ncbi:hypothetical protein D3C86_1332940 [compost metagenome]
MSSVFFVLIISFNIRRPGSSARTVSAAISIGSILSGASFLLNSINVPFINCMPNGASKGLSISCFLGSPITSKLPPSSIYFRTLFKVIAVKSVLGSAMIRQVISTGISLFSKERVSISNPWLINDSRFSFSIENPEYSLSPFL